VNFSTSLGCRAAKALSSVFVASTAICMEISLYIFNMFIIIQNARRSKP
jgi:hypothetical protein